MSNVAKRVIWRLESERYALTQGKLYDLGQQLPGDYYDGDPSKVGYKRLEHLRGEAAKLFFDTDMFFVKVSRPFSNKYKQPSVTDFDNRSPTCFLFCPASHICAM